MNKKEVLKAELDYYRNWLSSFLGAMIVSLIGFYTPLSNIIGNQTLLWFTIFFTIGFVVTFVAHELKYKEYIQLLRKS
jgi:uncharacterized membrane protein